MFLDFDRILGAELETVETRSKGLSQAWVVDHQSFMAAVETKSEGLSPA